MIDDINDILVDFFEWDHKRVNGLGYGSENMIVGMMNGTSCVQSSFVNRVPMYIGNRYFARIGYLISELTKPQQRILRAQYKSHDDDDMNRFKRKWEVVGMKKRTFYNKLHKIHLILDKSI